MFRDNVHTAKLLLVVVFVVVIVVVVVVLKKHDLNDQHSCAYPHVHLH